MLQKQVIPVKMAGGLDTKTDPRWVVPGHWSLLENCYMQRDGEIKKRAGATALATTVLAGAETANVTSGQRLAKYKDELLAFSDTHLYSWSAKISQWIERARFRTAIPEVRDVHSSTYDTTVPSFAVAGNVAVVAWEENSQSWYRVIDWQTGVNIAGPTQISTNVTRPRVIATTNYITVWYVSGTSLAYLRFTISSPATAPTTVTPLSGVLNATPNCDMMYRSDTTDDILVAAYRNDGNVHVGQWNISSGAATTAFVSTATGGSQCVGWHQQDSWSGSFCYLGIAHSVGGVVRKELNKTPLTVNATTAVDAGATTNVNSCTGFVEAGSATTVYDVTASPTYNAQIRRGSGNVMARSVSLASHCFRGPNTGEWYALVSYDSTTQSCYLLMRMYPEEIGAAGFPVFVMRAMYGSGSGTLARASCLPVVHSISSTLKSVAVGRRQRIDAVTGKFAEAATFQDGVSAMLLDFDTTQFGRPKEMGDMLFLPGGFGYTYEVRTGTPRVLPEHVPHVFPELPTLTPGGAGSMTASAKYKYVIVYARTDRRTGRIIRSAGSVPTEVTLSAAQSSVTVACPTLRVTSLDDYIIEVYRTEANGNAYYRVSSTASPTRNSLTADTVNFSDTTSDATLITGETLYTSGGTLDAFEGPATRVYEAHQNRMWAVNSEDGSLWPSLELESGMGLQYNHNLRIIMDNADGPPTALASMDDKLVIFKESAVYVLSGDGPNVRGDGNFPQPQRVSNVVGTTLPRSVVVTPLGVFFKDAKGFYLLTRSLEVLYIGAEIETYNSLTPTGAVLIASLNQVRWTTGVRTLVYDYHFKQWTTFTNQGSVDCEFWDGAFVFLSAFTGVVSKETAGTYTDSGFGFFMIAETSHMSFAGVRGFQRVYEVQIAGDYAANTSMTVTLMYDHGSSSGGLFSIANLNTIQVDNKYEARFRPTIRRCSSIKMRIEDGGSGNAGFTIGALSFVVGTAPGKGGRLGASNKLSG